MCVCVCVCVCVFVVSQALLLVGTKLLALYSVPSAPDLQSSDLFLLGLFVQDVLGRDSVPGMEMPEPGTFETNFP